MAWESLLALWLRRAVLEEGCLGTHLLFARLITATLLRLTLVARICMRGNERDQAAHTSPPRDHLAVTHNISKYALGMQQVRNLAEV
ncbi:hypothetical protein E2C01_034691 [Portunus trituberculatus]|uniref:Uncharacterized protein n=1 Tax=Portunus trituberculatus TaxID=210409 RepID=A0A5B7F6D3_PORTR|nr:hypothetical protein [Portunus trituberculatus]